MGSSEIDMNICLIAILGTGIFCSNPVDQPRVVDTSCQAFEPIHWSTRDTTETIEQAKQHNAVLVDLCPQYGPEQAGTQ